MIQNFLYIYNFWVCYQMLTHLHGMLKHPLNFFQLTSTSSVSLDMYDTKTESVSLSSSPASKGAACKGLPKERGSRQASLEQGELTSSHGSTGSKAITIINSLDSINTYINPLVKGLSPFKLSEVDEALKKANIGGK